MNEFDLLTAGSLSSFQTQNEEMTLAIDFSKCNFLDDTLNLIYNTIKAVLYVLAGNSEF